MERLGYSLSDLNRFAVNRAKEAEVVRNSLYDFVLYPTAGQTQLSLFQVPQGQGLSSSPGSAALTKRESDTNMTLAGQLPAPQAFLAESIEVHFLPGSVATANTYTPVPPAQFIAVAAAATNAGVTDVFAVLGSGALTFTIGSKNYLQEAELYRFPPKAYLDLQSALASNSATTALNVQATAHASGRPYFLRPELTLMTSQNFVINLTWPVAVATPSGFNGRLGVILDGVLFRLSQ